MAFDKNMVMSDSLFKIDFEEKDTPTLACPRCGHLNPRKPRTVCEHCNHFIPHDEARQDWASNKKVTAAELYGITQQEESDESAEAKSKDCSFKAGKKSYGWQCQVRRVAILFVMVAVAVAGTAYGLKTYMGDDKFNKLDRQLQKKAAEVHKAIKRKH